MTLLTPENKGALYAITSGLFFGLVGYYGMSIINANLSVSTMLFWRFLVASMVIGIVLVVQRKKIACNGSELLKVFFYGAALYSLSTMIYFTASKSIGTGLGMVIFFTFPAMIMIINWILYRTKIPKSYYAALALILVGMVLLVDISEFKFDIIGICLGLVSAFFYACYGIASKKSRLDPLLSTLMVSLGCMATSITIALFTQSFTIPTSFNVWVNIVGMGIICSAVPILFFLESLKYISTAKASLLSVLEPVFVVIFGVLLLGESMSILQIAGTVTILAGAMITLKNGNED